MTIKLLFIVNVDWFFLSHRLPIAKAAIEKGYEVHIATGLTDKLEELKRNGFVVHPLDIERSNADFLATWRILKQMVQVMEFVKPDLVHLVTIKPVLLGGIAARWAQAPSMVAAVSGLGFVFLAKGFWASIRRFLVGRLYRLALGHKNAKVIFQNPDDQASVARLANLPTHKAMLIRGSGVELDHFKLVPMPDGPPVVLLAARMLADKGVREFVSAAQELKGSNIAVCRQARYVLVGEPDPANPASLTQEELITWQQKGYVELWGHRTDMPVVLSGATIVVLPSYREGLPKVLIEAAACGRPVITTDVPGCRDAIEPGKTGLLVPVADAKALAQAIQELLLDPESCSLMGKAGRWLAEKDFDVKKVVHKHMEVYEELLAKAGR